MPLGGRAVPGPQGGVSEVVFAAGRGTRLRPLTERLPKALVPILDVPLLDLALARGEGVDWASRFVNVSHHGRAIRDHLEGRDVVILDEGDEPLGTAGTLRRLVPELAPTVVTYNCDLVSDIDLAGLVAAHGAGECPATLAVQPVTAGADLVREGSGLRLVDRRREDVAGLLFLGAACFERTVLEAIEPRVPLGLSEGLFRRLVEAGDVILWEHDGYARDVGTHQRYLTASLEMLARPDLIDPPGDVLGGGRAYVGPGATVGEGASLGHGAIVLAGAHVGGGASLSECIVCPGERVPEGTQLAGGIYFDDELIRI